MSYIGNTSTTQTYAAAIDYFSGNGSTTAFTLSKPVAATPQIQVVVNNVPQNPGTAFTVSGSTLTFTSAPSTGSNNIYVYYTSPVTQVIAPSAGTVQSSSIASGGPTWDASGNLYTYNTANIDCGNTFGFKNRIINGAMMIDQRNAGAAVTGNDSFPVDRFRLSYGNSSGAFSAQQSTIAPAGFTNSIQYTTTTADASLGASEYAQLYHAIEGLNVADLGWGTANAQPVVLSFWCRSSITGTFGGAIRNSAGNRSYPFTYTISSANTWEYKSIAIAGDTTGTWLTTNGVGMYINIGMGVGSTLSGTAGTWAGANYIGATGAVNLIATLNATFYITGVQLEKGSVATPFDYRPYGTELALCQRYYEELPAYYSQGFTVPNASYLSHLSTTWQFLVPKRATPSAGVLPGVTVQFDKYGIGTFTASTTQVYPRTTTQCTLSASLSTNQQSGDLFVLIGKYYYASAEL